MYLEPSSFWKTHPWRPSDWLGLVLMWLISCGAAFGSENGDSLVVAYINDEPPLQFTDESGAPAGILIDLWREWAQLSKREVVFRGGSREASRGWLLAGEVDAHVGLRGLAGSTGLGLGPVLQPAEIHFFHHRSIYQLRGPQDLRPFLIGHLHGDPGTEALEELSIPATNLVAFPDRASLIEALAGGEIRVFVADAPVALALLESAELRDDFRYNPVRPLVLQAYRVATAEGREALLETLESGFNNISGSTRGLIEERWLDRLRESTLDSLVVGLPRDSMPLSFVLGSGEPAGLLHDLWRLWARKTGKRVEFEVGTRDEIFRKLLDQEVDIHAGILVSKQREDYLDFSTPFYPVGSRLYATTVDAANLTLEQLGSQRVGVVRSSFYEDYLSARYPAIELMTFTTLEELAQGILEREVFAGIASTISFEPVVRRRGLEGEIFWGSGVLFRSQLQGAVLQGRSELLELVEAGLGSISNSELAAMEAKWIADPASRYYEAREAVLLLSEEEKKWLSSNPYLLYAAHPNRPPIDFFDRNGQHQGIAKAYMDLIASKLGVVLEPIPVSSWEDAFQKAIGGEADLIPALAVNEVLGAAFSFSQPYIELPVVLMVRADSSITSLRDLDGRRVAVYASDSQWSRPLEPGIDAELVVVESLAGALKELSLGGIDAVVTNLASASYEINRWQITNLKIAEEFEERIKVAIAVRRDLPLLQSAINKALGSISADERAAIERRWIAAERETWKPATEMVVALLMVVLLFLVSLYWNQKLSFQVRKRREAEKALLKSEERMAFALQAAEEGIWDRDFETGRSHFSPRFWEMLGYDPASPELLEKADFLDLIHDQDRNAFVDGLPRSLAEEPQAEGWTSEFRMRTSEGSYRWVLSRGLVVSRDEAGAPLRVVATHLDITNQREVEQALRVSEQRMRALGDNLVDGSIYQISLAPGGDLTTARLDYVSAGLERMVGITAGALQENPFRLYEIIHPEDRDGYQAGQMEAIRSRSVFRHEARVLSKEGHYRWMQFRSSPRIDPEGRIVFDGLMIDINDRKQAESAMLEAKEEADQANRAKSEFLANMSHEIRTPMNAIVGMSHLVLQTDLNGKQHDYITKIQSSSHRLLGILNDILDFSKIEAGKLEIEKVPFNLENVFGDLSNLVSLKAEEKGLELIFRISSDVPTRLIGDPLRLGQVLVNLTNNAVKFTDYGEIVVSIARVPQPINSDSARTELKFTVRDSGIGMTEEQVERLFQSFSQADSSITRKYGGTGLGLAISRRLVTMMNGKLSVSSEYGKGSRFMFTLPFLVDEEADLAPVRRQLPVNRAVVVDDNSTVRRYLAEKLQDYGIETALYDSGESLLNTLPKVSPEQFPEVVLLDWKMERMNGLETARRLRQNWARDQLPIILLVSSFGREEVMEEAEEIGVNGFMSKPISASSLVDEVMEVFGRSGSHNSGRDSVVGDDSDLAPIRGARILLVEDNKINQEVAFEILEGAGLKIVVANNGRECLDILKREQGDFDAVLMDLQMPIMDGFEATECIRRSDEFGEIPIIAMTAHAMESDRLKCLEAGMNDHTSKPIDPIELNRTLLRWVRRGRDAAASKTAEAVGPLEPEAVESLPEHLPGFDLERGVRTMSGNVGLYRKLLQQFANDYRASADEIKSAYYGGDHDRARHLAHTVKGVAGNLAAIRAHETAGELEGCILNKNHSQFPKFISAFARSMEEAINALAGLQRRQTAKAPVVSHEAGQLDRARVASLLERLHQMVAESRMDADEVADQVVTALRGTPFEGLAAEVAERIDGYDFEAAGKLIEKLAMGVHVPLDSEEEDGS